MQRNVQVVEGQACCGRFYPTTPGMEAALRPSRGVTRPWRDRNRAASQRPLRRPCLTRHSCFLHVAGTTDAGGGVGTGRRRCRGRLPRWSSAVFVVMMPALSGAIYHEKIFAGFVIGAILAFPLGINFGRDAPLLSNRSRPSRIFRTRCWSVLASWWKTPRMRSTRLPGPW